MIEVDEKEAHCRFSSINLENGQLKNLYGISNVHEMFSLDLKLSEIIQISKSIDKSPKTSRSVIYTNASQISVNLSNIFEIFKWLFLALPAFCW